MDVMFDARTPAIGADGQNRSRGRLVVRSRLASPWARATSSRAGSWTGWIDRRRRAHASSGHAPRGNRDKSWGPRRWGGPKMWRWFSINIDDDTHFGGIVIGTEAGDSIAAGCSETASTSRSPSGRSRATSLPTASRIAPRTSSHVDKAGPRSRARSRDPACRARREGRQAQHDDRERRPRASGPTTVAPAPGSASTSTSSTQTHGRSSPSPSPSVGGPRRPMRALVTGGNRYIGVHLLFELARPRARGHRRQQPRRRHAGWLPAHPCRPHGPRRAVRRTRTAPRRVRHRVRQHCVPGGRPRADARVVRGTGQPVRLHQLGGGVPAQLRATGSRRVPSATILMTPIPRKRYGAGKVACENHLQARFEATGFPATSLRVTHTLGPRTPLVTREPIIFKRLEERRPIFVPGDGFPFVHLVHVQDVAALMASPVRLGSCRRPDLQRRRLRVHEHRRLHPHDGQGGRRRARHRARPDGHRAAGRRRRSCTGERA